MYNEAQGPPEVESSTILHLVGYNQFLSHPVGEGNGNPLQCSCLENPRDGGAWRAAVSGVAQSWTGLKRLSSSSSSSGGCIILFKVVPCLFPSCSTSIPLILCCLWQVALHQRFSPAPTLLTALVNRVCRQSQWYVIEKRPLSSQL